MYLSDYFLGKRNKIICRLCGVQLKNEMDLDTHIRNVHEYDV
jgi:hypothetical protein